MNNLFHEIAVGAEFWCDGTFWYKTGVDTAESWSTTRKFGLNDPVVAHQPVPRAKARKFPVAA